MGPFLREGRLRRKYLQSEYLLDRLSLKSLCDSGILPVRIFIVVRHHELIQAKTKTKDERRLGDGLRARLATKFGAVFRRSVIHSLKDRFDRSLEQLY